MKNKIIKLLFVEDNKTDQMMFQRFVKKEQITYDYSIKNSFSSAKQAIEKSDFDIILTDYDLGDGTAFDLFKSIPEDIPTIIITGTGTEDLAVKAMKAGATDYLIKDPDGYYLKTLPITINNALRIKKGELELKKHQAGLEEMVDERTRQLHLAIKNLQNEIEERKSVELSLNKSRHFFSSTFNDMVTMIVILSPKGSIVFTNNTFLIFFGFKREIIIGNQFCDCISWNYDDKTVAIIQKDIEKCASGKTFSNIISARSADCKKIWVEYSMHPNYNSKNEIIYIVVEARDITARKKMENQLLQSQKMEAIGTLAGGIAHDFNNILFPIVGYTEMSINMLPEDSIPRKYLNEALKGSMRARDLVQQILTFSRQHEQELQLLKVRLVINEALKLIRASLPATIEIRQNITKNCGPIMADPTRIHQILMNLCTNAFHAMEESGGVLTVSLNEVKLKPEDLTNWDIAPGQYLCLKVSDTGCGMNQAVKERIFDPYFTSKKEGKGTGLGLAMVHGIVKGYKGNILVETELGKGTDFYIYLPMADKLLTEPAALINKTLPRGHEHILIVDDEKLIVTMEQKILENLGYQVTARTSSIEALEIFRAQPQKFDMVITDLTMPDMTGKVLSKKLLEIRSNLPIILCTGFSKSMTEENVESLGIKGFLVKPIIINDLAMLIRKILDSAP